MGTVSSVTSRCSSFWDMTKSVATDVAVGAWNVAKSVACVGAAAASIYLCGLVNTTAIAGVLYWANKEILGAPEKREVKITSEMAKKFLVVARANEELAKREEELEKLKANLDKDQETVDQANRELNEWLDSSRNAAAQPVSISPGLLERVREIVPKSATRLRSPVKKLNEGNLKEQLIQAVTAERSKNRLFNPETYVKAEISKLDISQAEKERVTNATMAEIRRLHIQGKI